MDLFATRAALRTVAAGLAATAMLTLAACAGRPVAPPEGECTLIAVTSTGWHAGLYLPAGAFAPDSPVRRAFPRARHVWVGWGEARAYPGPLTLAKAVRAIAWPTPSVVHVSAHERDPRTVFGQAHVDVAVSARTLDRLAAQIEAEIAGGPVAPGLTGESAFFPARSSYHALKTCNVWLAQALEEAGIETGWTPGHLAPRSLLRAVERRTPRRCAAG